MISVLIAAFVLVVPGAVAMAAVDPARRPNRVATAGLAVALSITIEALAVVLLDALSIRIESRSVLGLLAVAGGLFGIAFVLSGRTPSIRLPRSGLRPAHALPLLTVTISLLVVTVAVSESRKDFRKDARKTQFAQLWATDAPGGGASRVVLGVRNERTVDSRFTLTITDGRRELRRWRLKLGPDEEWVRTLTVKGQAGQTWQAVAESSAGLTRRVLLPSPDPGAR